MANPSLVDTIEHARVWNAAGQVVPLPTSKPIVFIAWWATNSQQALESLVHQGAASQVAVVSMYLYVGPPVKNASQAQKVTFDGLGKAGIRLPANTVFYEPPHGGLDRTVVGIPTELVHSAKGWYVLKGAIETPSRYRRSIP